MPLDSLTARQSEIKTGCPAVTMLKEVTGKPYSFLAFLIRVHLCSSVAQDFDFIPPQRNGRSVLSEI
jgi:hypothetical protein